jgi:hypothetical protein
MTYVNVAAVAIGARAPYIDMRRDRAKVRRPADLDVEWVSRTF